MIQYVLFDPISGVRIVEQVSDDRYGVLANAYRRVARLAQSLGLEITVINHGEGSKP